MDGDKDVVRQFLGSRKVFMSEWKAALGKVGKALSALSALRGSRDKKMAGLREASTQVLEAFEPLKGDRAYYGGYDVFIQVLEGHTLAMASTITNTWRLSWSSARA
jgi:hypothetical protein